MERKRFVDIRPIEEVIRPNGTEVFLEAKTDSEESVSEFCEFVEKTTGNKMEVVGKASQDKGSSKSFGFASLNWDNCQWIPRGSIDPSKN